MSTLTYFLKNVHNFFLFFVSLSHIIKKPQGPKHYCKNLDKKVVKNFATLSREFNIDSVFYDHTVKQKVV